MDNNIKRMIADGQHVVGCFIGFYSPAVAEMIAYAGVDVVVIDNEHGSFSWGEVEEMIRAVELAGAVPFVRVAYDRSDVLKALDRGARGLHIPMVNTREDAERAVRCAKFPPLGNRGAAYSCRAARYGLAGGGAYLERSNEDTLLAVHIETPEAVRNIDDIMAVPGIDVCYIGPTDLSVTMGYGAEGPGHPDVRHAMDAVLAAGKRNGVAVGIQVPAVSAIGERRKWGSAYTALAVTSVLLPALAGIAAANRD